MSVGAAIVESVAVLYGCLLLTFASVYALTLKETWVGPSEAEKKNTAASKHFHQHPLAMKLPLARILDTSQSN
jgi:hypothetical protein